MAQTTPQQTARELARARRRAQSVHGRAASGAAASGARPQRERPAAAEPAPAAPAAPPPARQAVTPAPSRRSTPPAPDRSTTRAIARRRRTEMATAGKKADTSRDRTRSAPAPQQSGAKKEGGCGCGCKDRAKETPAGSPGDDARGAGESPARATAGKGLSLGNPRGGRTTPRQVKVQQPPARLVSKARRAARSATGKGASNAKPSEAGLARQANPRLSSRELAQKVREKRSTNGKTSGTRSAPCGRVRPSRTSGEAGGARDAEWKVGASETGGGQIVTGTRVGRSADVTGDEASTCRTITGTEYMGADIFREFCQTEPKRGPGKVGLGSTSRGNRVTGNEVGRSSRVTGDEPGTCKIVTGTEYLSAENLDAFCGVRPAPSPARGGRAPTRGGEAVSGTQVGRSPRVTGDEPGSSARLTGSQYSDYAATAKDERVPPKVGVSVTLSGGAVTGTRVGRSERVTGDEPGSCKRVTGDEYTDLNQYEAFCATKPEPSPPKVDKFSTLLGRSVTGTRTGRSAKVTGDEPGTCKAVTGTPYGATEDLEAWCNDAERREAKARSHPLGGTPGPAMTGLQPGIGGVMTGAERGACDNVSGTPYVGRDQFGEHCGALPGQDDFPQALDGAPWQSFSVTSPARQAHQARSQSGVTGTRYEQGQITGAFAMGTGKVTGTEEFRFDRRNAGSVNLLDMPAAPEGAVEEAVEKPRITGEGQSAGRKITGDDWERNERVTGTEGSSAMRRNPTRRGGPMSAMPAFKRNTDLAQPESLVSGSVGTTDSGALITYSGGARG